MSTEVDNSEQVKTDLAQMLDSLTPDQLRFVTERSNYRSDTAACKGLKIGRSTLASWKQDVPIDEIIRLMALDVLTVAREKLKRAVTSAVDVMIEDVEKGRKHSQIRQKAAQDILDRNGVTAPKQVDVTSGGEPIKGYIGISPDDWDNESED